MSAYSKPSFRSSMYLWHNFSEVKQFIKLFTGNFIKNGRLKHNMKKLIGWIEIILGVILTILPIFAIISISQFVSIFEINSDPTIPEEFAKPIESISKTVPLIVKILAGSYLLIVFLIGLLMTLEGLSKIKD